MKTFNACVKRVLLYSFESRIVTEAIKNKLQAVVNKCPRYILMIWWPEKITNIELWRITGQSDINLEVSRRKFVWLGHTQRKGYDENHDLEPTGQ
jgi:hypothetical protein